MSLRDGMSTTSSTIRGRVSLCITVGVRGISGKSGGTTAIEKPKIHASVFARVACRTDGYGPGNIPANLEVVNTERTPGQLRPVQIDKIRDLVQTELQSLGKSSLQELPDVRF